MYQKIKKKEKNNSSLDHHANEPLIIGLVLLPFKKTFLVFVRCKIGDNSESNVQALLGSCRIIFIFILT